MWNGCLRDGVYDTRIECADNCNPDEDAAACVKPRKNPCNRFRGEYQKNQYFYNITSGTCEKYIICSNVGGFMEENSFNSKTLCTLQCRGFTLAHVQNSSGSKLLDMLNTTQYIWVYSSNYRPVYKEYNVQCAKYKKYQLNRTNLAQGPDYDYDFFYEREFGGKTYETRLSSRLWMNNKTGEEYIQVDKAKVLCELHVWEDGLKESYEKYGTYNGCQEKFLEYCAGHERYQLFHSDCNHIAFPKLWRRKPQPPILL
ncbi:uncharacterized protein LOC142586842 isoform X2 [Dermacentor variabilis]|uniref:uncharacterized protein LOC142586842 isoform X2 n=1 Tax=Dermacentor variabilis TaxID=34621 RepID=UPI003F5C82FE